MHLRDQVRFDHQRHSRTLLLAFKPGKGAVIGNRAEQGLGALAADPQRSALAAIAITGNVAQLGQHPILEPAQQRRAFAIGAAIGVERHDVLHLGPVLYRDADVGQSRLKRLFQRAALAGISTAGFDIDHRFAFFAGRFAFDHFIELAIGVAPHCQHRVQQAIYGEAVRGNRCGNRIDQKRHIVVNQGKPHEPLTRCTGDGFDGNSGSARCPFAGRSDHEFRGAVQSPCGKWGVTG